MNGPMAAVVAKVGALEALRPRLFAAALVLAGVLLVAGGLTPAPEHPRPPEAASQRQPVSTSDIAPAPAL